MKLQHDTHYITKSLDVRYVVKDSKSSSFLSKHSLYNPNNIDNTEAISDYGTSFSSISTSKDILPGSALCIKRNDEDFILLQNFEFVNYYSDYLVETATNISDRFRFLSDNNTKQGCIKVRVHGTVYDIINFPILALITYSSCTIKDKLDNLIRCL